MKRLWMNLCIWWNQRHYKRTVKRSMKKYPRAYKPQGWEFDEGQYWKDNRR